MILTIILGTIVTHVKWLTVWESVQYVLRYATRTMMLLMPSTVPSFVIVEPKKMVAVL